MDDSGSSETIHKASPEPGPLESQLQLELSVLPPQTAGYDGTLRAVALTVARMADRADDFRSKMAAIKEYRSVLGQLTAGVARADASPAVVDEQPDGPFGACRPELTGEVNLGECVPRWATRRRLERPTWGPYFGRVAAAMGKPFMPWQQHAADILGEVDHTGQLCYQQIVMTVPRQSGKTTLILSIVVGRAEAGTPFGGRQSMLYAAQTQTDATKKFQKEYIPELKASEVTAGTFKSRINGGVPTLTFNSSQSTFAPTTTGPKAAHGDVLDFACIDEAFSQPDDSVEGAMDPAMITRKMAQMVIPSTAGDSTSTYFRAKVESGRKAADRDSGYGTAYIEYSADEKAAGFDPGDESMWRRVMPALGHTQPIASLRKLYLKYVDEGKLNIWLRAFLNIWVDRRSDPVFKAGKWEAVCRPDAERRTRPVITIDVSASRECTSIGIGAMATVPGEDGELVSQPMVRIVDYRAGTEWVVDRVIELRDEYDAAAVILDAAGPGKSLIPELQNNYIDVTVTQAHEMAGACGMFYDAVDQGALFHFGEPCLELAVAGAEKRVLSDAWAWTRSKSAAETGTDISPLVACTLAYWGQIKYGDDLDFDLSDSFG